MILGYAVLFSVFDAILYRYYLYTNFDLAIFAQAMDGLLHGSVYSSIRGMVWLADHSSLVLYLIAPLYAVFRHPITLLVVQSTAQALGAVPMFALARREIGSEKLALVFAALYLLQPALGYSNLFEFHPELLATAPLLAAFYFLRRGRLGPMAIWAGVALLCREDVAPIVGMMALYALTVRQPHRHRLAMALFAAAAGSALVTFGVLRPLFSAGAAEYGVVYSTWGPTLGSALRNMLLHPADVLIYLVSTPGYPLDTLVKQQFHLTLFLPLGLLPLMSPITLAVALPVFVEHLLSGRVPQHTILCQYTALQIPFVSAAAVMGARNLIVAFSRPREPRGAGRRGPGPGRADRGEMRVTARAITLWALVASLGCQIWFGPILSSGRFFITGTRGRHLPTSEERTLAADRDALVARVPPRGGVVASFELLNRFASRDSLFSLDDLLGGGYSFSSRQFPTPRGISAIVADVSAVNLLPAVRPESAERLQAAIRANQLVPVAAYGDLVLFLQGGGPPVELVRPAPLTVGPDSIGFDGQLAFLGGAVTDTVGRPGGIVRLHTDWLRTGPIDRFHRIRFECVDASGRVVQSHERELGYLGWPPHVWNQGQAMREEYRLPLKDDLAPGDYRVFVRVLGRGPDGIVPSVPNDPTRTSTPIVLGRFRVGPSASLASTHAHAAS